MNNNSSPPPDDAPPRSQPRRIIGHPPSAATSSLSRPQILGTHGVRVQLAQFEIFAGFTAKHLEQLERGVQRRWVPAGYRLIDGEDPSDLAYIILRGIMKVVHNTDGGDEVILTILGPGDVVGEMGLVDEQVRSASVVAMENAVVLVISRRAFHWCLREVPDFSMNLVRMLSKRLRLADEQIGALATTDVQSRMARVLLQLADRFGTTTAFGTTIPFRLTQAELGAMVGASRVRVNQILGDFRDSQWIRVDGSRISVIDGRALRRNCGNVDSRPQK